MSEITSCSSLEISLDRVRLLKERFLLDYNNNVGLQLSHEQSEQMRARKQELELSISAFEKEVFLPALEMMTGIRKQYDNQVSLLKGRGVLQEWVTMNPLQNKIESVFAVLGIDGKEYPVPSFEGIIQKIYEQREVLKIKMDQGFTKLLLVPFATSILNLVNYASVTGNVEGFRENSVITSGDVEGRMRYGFNCIDDTYQGATKADILKGMGHESAFATNGWRIVFARSAEEGRGLANASNENTQAERGEILPRPALEGGCPANEYLQLLNGDLANERLPYFEERGMCVEDWIIASMCHFLETGKRLDSLDEGGADAFLLGCSVAAAVVGEYEKNNAIIGACKDEYGGMYVSTTDPNDANFDTNAHTVVRIM